MAHMAQSARIVCQLRQKCHGRLRRNADDAKGAERFRGLREPASLGGIPYGVRTVPTG